MTSISPALLYVALVAGIMGTALGGYCVIQYTSLKKLKNGFFAGSTGKDLESVIHALAERASNLELRQNNSEQSIKNLQEHLGFVIQKVGMVRFNPFEDGGGNFSFTVALLDGHNNGVIITSMYGRQQNRIYAKHITGGKSDTTLTEEEHKAIEIAGQ